MVSITEITSYLDELLSCKNYSDYGFNGLQVSGKSSQIANRVALAVDSGKSIIERAIADNADLLIVHHGLFWGDEQPIVGPLAEKLQLLLTSNCALYAAHLPLDGNLMFGNAAQLAKHYGFTEIKPAFLHKGSTIGITALCSSTIKEIVERSSLLHGSIKPLLLDFGNKPISSVGIVTGSGTSAIEESKLLGLDLLISGEPQQKAYHLAKELKQNVLFIGHYASETLGVQALGKSLTERYGINTFFIDEPTGI